MYIFDNDVIGLVECPSEMEEALLKKIEKKYKYYKKEERDIKYVYDTNDNVSLDLRRLNKLILLVKKFLSENDCNLRDIDLIKSTPFRLVFEFTDKDFTTKKMLFVVAPRYLMR